MRRHKAGAAAAALAACLLLAAPAGADTEFVLNEGDDAWIYGDANGTGQSDESSDTVNRSDSGESEEWAQGSASEHSGTGSARIDPDVQSALDVRTQIMGTLTDLLTSLEDSMRGEDGSLSVMYSGSYPYRAVNISFANTPMIGLSGIAQYAEQIYDLLTPSQVSSCFGGLAGNAKTVMDDFTVTDAGAWTVYSEGGIAETRSSLTDAELDGILSAALSGSSASGGTDGSPSDGVAGAGGGDGDGSAFAGAARDSSGGGDGGSGDGTDGDDGSGTASGPSETRDPSDVPGSSDGSGDPDGLAASGTPAEAVWTAIGDSEGLSLSPAQPLVYSVGGLGSYAFDPSGMSYVLTGALSETGIQDPLWKFGQDGGSPAVTDRLPNTGYRTDLVSGGFNDADTWPERFLGYEGSSSAMEDYVTVALIDEYCLTGVTLNEVSDVSFLGDERFWKIVDGETGEVIEERTTDNPEHVLIWKNVPAGKYEVCVYEGAVYTSRSYASYRKNMYMFDAATKNLLYYNDTATVKTVRLSETTETGYALQETYELTVNALGDVAGSTSPSGTERVK